MTNNVPALLEQLKQAREEVDQLKIELAKLNKVKESFYQKKVTINQGITNHIQTLSKSKSNRNTLTTQVRDLKENRNKLNTQINNEVAAIKALKEEHQRLMASNTQALNTEERGRRGRDNKGGGNIHEQIKELEYKLETEPTSFDKEQKIVKKIKDLKKKVGVMKNVHDLSRQIREKSKEIDRLKREANEYHQKMRLMAGESQGHHEVLVGNSKEIDEMRAQEKAAHEEFMKLKTEYQTKNDELKQKLDELKKIREQLDSNNVKVQDDFKEEERKTLKEKEAEVNEKIKQRKKLTTEDLLVMQHAEGKGGKRKR
ncbi:MAG: hypothetical protein AABX70_07865 [Nanoarchaeota archaeon]|mgnify:CR=1 FL=1